MLKSPLTYWYLLCGFLPIYGAINIQHGLLVGFISGSIVGIALAAAGFAVRWAWRKIK